MALTTAIRTNLHLVVHLGFVWACGMVTLSTAHTSLPDNVIGIYSPITGTTSTVSCLSGANFRSWSTWARCCASDSPSCDFVTRCDGGTAYSMNGNTGYCNQDFPNCITMTIYDRYHSPSHSWLDMECGTRWSANTIYRELEESTTSTSTTPATTPSASTSEPSLTSAVTTPTSSSPFLTGAPIDPNPSTSKAWIAGPVAGGIVALLLLGALFFWWRRRKSAQESNDTPSMAQTGAAGGYFPEYVGSPHENNRTPQIHGPSSPPAASYDPSNSPPHYSSPSPGPHDALNTSQYKDPPFGTPNTTSWQEPSRPVAELDATGMAASELDATGMAVSELDSTVMQHQHTTAEAS